MSSPSQPDFPSDEPPALRADVLAVPKGGAGMDAYEDAARGRTEGWPVRVAVADGATESAFARAWAERLVDGYVEQGPATPDALRDAVPDWQADWREAVQERVGDRPWYVGAKAAEGAFATLLGLSLDADGAWRAMAVGDCCLFQVRDGAAVQSWPADENEAFTNRPALVPSRPDHALPVPEETTGTWRPGDRFLLASDAVAAWLLKTDAPPRPADAESWDGAAFRDAVERARADGPLRNDDATLLVVRPAGPNDAGPPDPS